MSCSASDTGDQIADSVQVDESAQAGETPADNTEELAGTGQQLDTFSAPTGEDNEIPAETGSISGGGPVASQPSNIEPLPEYNLDGWIRVWGRGRVAAIYGVDMDASGNIYVSGTYNQTADFMPGPETLEIRSNGDYDVFLSKFDGEGNLLWVKTWGSGRDDFTSGLAVDRNGNCYIPGSMSHTVDFDPDESEDAVAERTPEGRMNVYLTSLDSDGNFRWVRTIGDWYGQIEIKGVDVDSSGNPVITGWFSGEVDFDKPDDPEEESTGRAIGTARSGSDAYAAKYSSAGSFQWAATWSGDDPSLDQITGTCVTIDGSNNAIIGGRFQGRFEVPGLRGIEMNLWHSSQGMEDSYVVKLDSRGYPQWVRTWGGESSCVVYDVAATGNGNVYITGGIAGICDLDPGFEVDEHDAGVGGFAYLSKLTSSGGFLWGRSWGLGLGMAVTTDNSGDAIVTGQVTGEADMNPDRDEDAVDEQFGAVFVARYLSSGDYDWSIVWGRTDNEFGSGITTDAAGNIYSTGLFRGELTYTPDEGFNYLSQVVNPDAFLIKILPDGTW